MAIDRPKPDFVDTDVTGEDYPYKVPDSPKKIRTLDIDDVERAERYRKLYGGCVSDAMWLSGIVDTILDHEIKSLKANDTIAGRCVPIKWHTVAPETHMTQEEKDARELKWQKEDSPQKRMMKSITPGSVLVFDTGGDMQAAQFGEMSCNLAKSRGCVGVVNSGMTRDTQYIFELGDFPYFARGTTPNFYGGWRVLEVNIPIRMPGHLTHYVVVNPGDFIFGDLDGLQVIPEKYVDEVLIRAEEIFAFENAEREAIRNGMPIDEVYDTYGDL
ncbi:RraA family protein [Candidatus Latescibacterota bacterium]